MVDRINLILKAKNITARQFAEEIGIQPSGMSHILSGRNNPSLDFVMKVMRRWPEININWLMLGKGEMFADTFPQAASPARFQPAEPLPVEQPDLFSQPVDVSQPLIQDTPVVPQPSLQPEAPVAPQPATVPLPAAIHEQASVYDYPSQPESPAVEEPKPQLDENRLNEPSPAAAPVQPNLVKRRLLKMILVYDDHTFAEYTPEA